MSLESIYVDFSFPQNIFNYHEIVEDTTSLCGLTNLSNGWENSSPIILSLWAAYSSNILTTQRLGSCVYGWYETVGGALPLFYFFSSLRKQNL